MCRWSILTLVKVLNLLNLQKKVDGSKDFMISDAVLNLVAEAMVEFRERILKPNSLKPPRN